MNYAKLIRSMRYQISVEPAQPTESEMVRLLRELSKKADNIPSQLKEENSLLDDYEVNELLTCALDFQNKYFKQLPLAKELIKEFIWNIPRDILKGVRLCKNNDDIPDVLNPMFLMYLFLTKEPSDGIGLYLEILREQIDGNREAIKDDAQRYLADQMEPDEDEEE